MSADDDKKTRLAQALRANLARRKAQGRARAVHEPDAAEVAAAAVAAVGEGDAPEAEGGAASGRDRIVPPDGAG